MLGSRSHAMGQRPILVSHFDIDMTNHMGPDAGLLIFERENYDTRKLTCVNLILTIQTGSTPTPILL